MNKVLFIFYISLFTFLKVTAQDLSSPQASLETFLKNIQGDSNKIQTAAVLFKNERLSNKQSKEAAIKLIQIMDGRGHYIDLDEVPNEPNYYDSANNSRSYIIINDYQDIKLVKKSDRWVFNYNSIKAIEKVHGEIFKFGSDKLLTLLPKLGTREIFGIYFFQYIGLLTIIFLAFFIHKILSFIINKLFLRFVKKSGYDHLTDGYLLPVARPASIFLVVGLVSIFVPVLQLSPEFSRYLVVGLSAAMPLFGTVVFYRLVNILALYLTKVADKTESSLDDQLVPLIRKTLKTFVVLIGTLFVLDNLNIDIIPLLTGLSIGGLAFALAAQDTIKNFFGSLMIFVDKPFQIGHWITSGEIDGTVEEVGFRSSRIRTFRNSVMYVPNGKLADSTIDNHGLRQYRRFYTQIAVTYDTPPELIETFVAGLRKIVEQHPDTRKDYYHIYFNDMAAFSLNIMFYVFFTSPNWPGELKARHEILLEILKLAQELGINFAFPTQTLHMENFPGQPSLSPEYMDKDQMEKKLASYFKNNH